MEDEINERYRSLLSLSLSHSVFILFLFNLRLVPLALKHRIVRAFSVLLSRTVFSCSSSFSHAPSFSLARQRSRFPSLRLDSPVLLIEVPSTASSLSLRLVSFFATHRSFLSSARHNVALSPFLFPATTSFSHSSPCAHPRRSLFSIRAPTSVALSVFLFSFRG